MRDGPFVLASSVSNLTSPCNERTWNAKGTDTIMTYPEREAPKARPKRSAALRSPKGITPSGIYTVFITIKGAVDLHDVSLMPKCCLFS